jgi:hypothetical protein
VHIAGARGEADGAEVDRLDPAWLVGRVADGDLGRGTADVADGDGRRQFQSGGEHGAAIGERALLVLREHAYLHAGRPRKRRHELVGVGRLPAGSREKHVE